MRSRWPVLFGSVVLVCLAGGPSLFAQATPSRCADCHLARPDAPGARHVSDWDLSLHGRNNVGCEMCHGGNPNTFEPFLAHQGILHFRNPASPIARQNLTATCGRCHVGARNAFERSHHFTMLKDGNRDGPTCVTCHGEVAAYLLSPRQLEGQCNSCHGPGKSAPRPEYATNARAMLEGVRDARAQLKEASAMIRRVQDRERRAALEAEALVAATPLIEATDAGHAFVFDNLQERLALGRKRLVDLFARIVGRLPSSPRPIVIR